MFRTYLEVTKDQGRISIPAQLYGTQPILIQKKSKLTVFLEIQEKLAAWNDKFHNVRNTMPVIITHEVKKLQLFRDHSNISGLDPVAVVAVGEPLTCIFVPKNTLT